MALAASTALAGNLTPPFGGVAPTMKTLDQVEPRIPINQTTTPGDATAMFVINVSGSYYLDDDIISPGGDSKTGIRITTRAVTIDLRGHTVLGSLTVGAGIHGTAPAELVTIKNGRVRFWSDDGILLEGPGCRVINVASFDNSLSGIKIGDGGQIIDCLSNDNGKIGVGPGIVTGAGCLVVNSVSSFNQNDDGFSIGPGSLIQNCVAYTCIGGNGFELGDSVQAMNCVATGNAFAGFEIGSGCRLEACASRQNGTRGFSSTLGVDGVLFGCTAANNTLQGVIVDAGWTFTQCTIVGNGWQGINAGDRTLVDGCVIAGNSDLTANRDGVNAGAGSVVRGCQITDNGGDGVDVFGNSSVEDCVIEGNGFRGVNVQGTSTVLRNRIVSNGADGSGDTAAGILLSGTNSLADSNYLSSNAGDGIRVNGSFIMVARNVLIPDSIFDNGANNEIGSIVTSPIGAGSWDNISF